jgi:hypothetical protein
LLLKGNSPHHLTPSPHAHFLSTFAKSLIEAKAQHWEEP